ncbi:MAG: hypothetical protein IKI24_03220 [Clostridia bacterium]|nr:hypothetical protein [Clostridia bacterium]
MSMYTYPSYGKGRRKISTISMLHYVRLAYRSVLFILLLISYIRFRIKSSSEMLSGLVAHPAILAVTWIVFAFEMLLRFFPSRYESPGSQKQFARNYIKSGNTDISIPDNNATLLVALVWIIFNGVFGALHMLGILDDGIMLLLCGFYSVCDMICILFFCPFQSWLLKNKCCSSCRIYNWDYAMMFTPLFFVRRGYYWSLLVLSVVLLLRWEITFFRHPERFSEKTNEYLKCMNCTEKLCSHKKQLKTLWRQIERSAQERLSRLRKP